MAIIITTKTGMQNTTKGLFEAISWVLEGMADDPTRHMFEGLMGERDVTAYRLTATDGKQARTILVEGSILPPELVLAIDEQDAKKDNEYPQSGIKLFAILGKPSKDTIVLGDHECTPVFWRKVFIDRSALTGNGSRADVKGIIDIPEPRKDKAKESGRVSEVSYAVFTATGKPYSMRYMAALNGGEHVVMTHGITAAFHLCDKGCKAISPSLREMTLIVAAMNDDLLVKVEPLALSLEKSY